jgi:predicted nucleic acid-binding protein
VAGLIDEPAAPRVTELLEGEEGTPRISVVNLAAALDSITRRRGWPHAQVAEKLDWLKLGGLQIEPVTEMLATAAAKFRSRHYHRQPRPVSIADCIALALALELGDQLATSDPALLATGRDENCVVVALPDSEGTIAD